VTLGSAGEQRLMRMVEVWHTCNGQGVKRMAAAGLAWLDRHHEAVNALNVFPVPDGDTGTNMLLTMRNAYQEIAASAEDRADRICAQLYNGALMGARGNSGVILSQLWRGFARAIEGMEAFDVHAMAAGLRQAAEIAYQGVQEPVEGTMLTVAREIADAAADAASQSDDLGFVLERVVERAHQAVARTQEQLDVLREAGVVDAGGQGLALLLEGMLRYLKGESLEFVPISGHEVHPQSALDPGEAGYGYDVQFVLKGKNLDVDRIRREIAAMGNSTLVVGDANTVKVHVHVHDPGQPLSYGAGIGVLGDVVVENMQEQYQQFMLGRDAAHEQEGAESPSVAEGEIAAIAVAPGDGLRRVFHSLGAYVVPGGQTMNPSTEQLIQAVNSLPTDKIILLPNNKNIRLAAEQAAQLAAPRQVIVIPSESVPQGVAALLALQPDGDLQAIAGAMQAAMSEVESGEITTATRNASLGHLEVHEGQIIGLHNDRLCVAGNSVEQVAHDLLSQMDATNRQLVTLYYGDGVSAEQAYGLAEWLRHAYPGLEFEVVEGGQAHYFYILSVE
jgi:DAK2 domain fusion protein YloV